MKYRIKDLREDKDLTQSTLANYLNMKQNSYSYLENEKITIDIEYIIKLAKFYNVSTDYILKLTDNPKPYPKVKQD